MYSYNHNNNQEIHATTMDAQTISRLEPEATSPAGDDPTTNLLFMSPDELEQMVHKDPEKALGQHADLLCPEQIDACCREVPEFALLFCKKSLTTDQFEYCVLQEPQAALRYANTLALTEEEIDECRRFHPLATRSNFLPLNLNADLLAECIRREPGIALQNAFVSGSDALKLSDEQFEYCLRRAPDQALRCPACALKAAADRMDDPLFEQCAIAASSAALQYAWARMTDPIFEQCAQAVPAGAFIFSPERLTDQEILNFSRGRSCLIHTLLLREPKHPLTKRLSLLYNRLDSETASVVIHAIASGI